MSDEHNTVGSILPHLSADDLDALVKTEMFGDAEPGLVQALELNLHLWKSSLSRIIRSIETQVAERRAALGKKPEEWREFDEWRRKSMHVLRKAQERHSYVKAKMVVPLSSDRPIFNRTLIAAIASHRLSSERSGREPSDFDLALWDVIS